MKINDDNIISAAKSLRARQESKLTTPQNPLAPKHSKTVWIAAAACTLGFLFGFGLRPSMLPFADGNGDTQHALIDSLQQEVLMARNMRPEAAREVVHDTIVKTRVFTKEIIREVPLTATNELKEDHNTDNHIHEPSQSAPVGCSMMCDNISYDLIASKN